MSEALTFVNVVGNCMAAIGIAKWEGAVDINALQEKIGIPAALPVPAPRPAE
jgi:aerobic C4-dicarboxylate transport protein